MGGFYNCAIFTLCSIFSIFPLIVNAQQCPSYTHKTTVTSIRDSLPNGWFLFGLSGTNGLYKCDNRTGTPAVIPNTSNDRVLDIDITDDGQWIVYLVKGPSVTVGRRTVVYKNFVYMIKPDGTGRTSIPVVIDSSTSSPYPPYVQFYHHSPYSNELVYISGLGRLRGIIYHLDNQNNVVLDSSRTIISFLADSSNPSGIYYAGLPGNRQFSIYKNRFYSATYIPEPPDTAFTSTSYLAATVRSSYVTIPYQGTGIAHAENIYKWTNDDYGLWYGCGLTMSIDGSMCLANTNAIGGSSGCVPTQTMNPPMDHKGFYVTRFMYDTMPSIERDAVVLDSTYGISINWCPTQYRVGTYDELGFTGWSFSNNNGYVIGEQEGNNTPIQGAWIVNIPTNTWTLVYTASNNRVVSPSLYLPGMTDDVRHGMQPLQPASSKSKMVKIPGTCAGIILEKSVYRCEIYSLTGKQLWKYERTDAGKRIIVDIPHQLRTNNAMVAKYSGRD
jgi:hypothetical protein